MKAKAPGVGGGVAAGGAADRALVDGDHPVEGGGALERPVRTRLGPAAPEPAHQGAVEDVVHQGRLAGAGHAGDRGQDAQGDPHVEVAQVVGAGAQDGERPLGGPAHRRHLDPELAPQVAAGEAAVDVPRRALVHHPPAQAARPFPEVHHVVGGPDGLLVVLHHHHGVAEVADLAEGLEQAQVVALVEAHRGLVQDVEHALHPGADLRGQADAVRLASGERGGGPVEGQIARPRPTPESAGARRSPR